MTDSTLRVEVLDKRHKGVTFSSGVVALDNYFRDRIGREHKSKATVPYVLEDTSTGGVIGYYTLSSTSILPKAIPPDVAKRLKLPKYSLWPAILLGRLAVDQRYQRQGFGTMLLWDALARALSISASVGAIAVVIDAKDAKARNFYEQFECLRDPDNEFRLYFMMQTISEAATVEDLESTTKHHT